MNHLELVHKEFEVVRLYLASPGREVSVWSNHPEPIQKTGYILLSL